MCGVAMRPAVPAAAPLRNFRRPTGLSAAFDMNRVPPAILAKRRLAVKAGSTIVDVRGSGGVESARHRVAAPLGAPRSVGQPTLSEPELPSSERLLNLPRLPHDEGGP